MQITPRKTMLITTIVVLFLILNLWFDELAEKQMGLLPYKHEIVKIVLHSSLAFIVATFINKKYGQIKSLGLDKSFMVAFLVLNSYIIIQYTYRLFSHRIVNSEMRSSVNKKTKILDFAGWGMESDSLSYLEFKELVKYTNLPDIPENAENIYVYDWYEFDFERIIKFDLEANFDIETFYINDLPTLKKLKKIDYEYDDKTGKFIEYDTLKTIRYKWQAGHI